MPLTANVGFKKKDDKPKHVKLIAHPLGAKQLCGSGSGRVLGGLDHSSLIPKALDNLDEINVSSYRNRSSLVADYHSQ